MAVFARVSTCICHEVHVYTPAHVLYDEPAQAQNVHSTHADINIQYINTNIRAGVISRVFADSENRYMYVLTAKTDICMC